MSALSDLHCPVCVRETTHEVMTPNRLRCVICGVERTVRRAT